MRPRLLVIDDEIELLLLLVAAARERGYEATGTIDPRTVLPRVRAAPPDVVLLDLRMPCLDGRDLLARMREVAKPPAVIVVTGWLDELTDDLCRAYGAVDLVRKPFDLDDLFRRVEAALGIGGQR
jgi:DNA-binding response OmpR family regulator